MNSRWKVASGPHLATAAHIRRAEDDNNKGFSRRGRERLKAKVASRVELLQAEVADARRAFRSAISAIRERIEESVALLESGRTGEARTLLLHQIEVLKVVERKDTTPSE